MSETIAAVVVTYNRKQLLTECLDALLAQMRPVNKIILVDNASTDGTSEMLEERGYLLDNLVEYVRLPENSGGAGGFYEGVKRARDSGYDWIWLMDDDAEAQPETLRMMLEIVGRRNLRSVCPLIVTPSGKVQAYHHKVFDSLGREHSALEAAKHLPEGEVLPISANAFVGPLFHSSVVRKIGLPNPKFFIWGDDTEYTIRISRTCGLYLCNSVRILHKDESIQSRVTSTRGQNRRLYYVRRNLIWIRRQHFHGRARLYPILRQIASLAKINYPPSIYWAKLTGVLDGIFSSPTPTARSDNSPKRVD